MYISILGRELRLILTDRAALLTIIVMPIVLMAILGLSLQGMFTESVWTTAIPIGVVQEYQPDPDRQQPNPEKIFFGEFLENEQVKKMVSYTVISAAEADRLLASEEIAAYVVLPQNYVAGTQNNISLNNQPNEPVNIKIIADPERNYSALVVEELIKVFNASMQDMTVKTAILERSFPANLNWSAKATDIARFYQDNQQEISIENIEFDGKKQISSFQYYSAAIMSMFLFFSAGVTATRLLDERRGYTWQRQIVAGIRPATIILANCTTAIMVSLIQMLIVVIFSSLAFGVAWGSLTQAAVVGLCAALSIGGLGAMLAVLTAVTGNYKVITALESVIVQIFALLGGSYLPVELLPPLVQRLSNFTLNGLAIQAFTKTMQGYNLSQITPYLSGLIIFAVLFLVIAYGIFVGKRRQIV